MLKDFLLKQMIHAMVERSNAKVDITAVMRKYNSEGRTIVMIITDLGDDVGFTIQNGKIIYGVELQNPTCLIQMNKDTFLAIATRKISQTQAYMMGAITVDGKKWLRDSILVDKIFNVELKDVMLPLH